MASNDVTDESNATMASNDVTDESNATMASNDVTDESNATMASNDVTDESNATMASNDVTDIELREIAEEIGHGIDRLGLRLGFTWLKVQRYQFRNRLTWSSSGTMEMLHSWRRMQSTRNQRAVLVNRLQKAGLVELAERVQQGEFITDAPDMHDLSPAKFTINWIPVLAHASLLIVLLAIVWIVFCANLLFLSADIKELRGHLIHHYDSSFCDIKTVPWNSSSILDLENIFINLNLLHRDVDQGSKLVRKSLYSHTKLFQLKARKGRVAKRILLRGAAGTGKTTLTCKIAHDWGRCLWGFSIRCTPLVIILQLRLVDPKNTLGQEVLNQDLVPRDRQEAITAELIDNFISQNPESAVIIFDGYDEYVDGSLKDETQKGVLDILRYKSYRDTTVMVTCRPWRIADFDDVPHYTHVELTGFTNENVVAYVKKFFRYNETKSDELLKWLSGGKYLDSGDSILQEAEVIPCDNYYFDCNIEDVSYMSRYPLFLTMFCELSKNESFLRQFNNVPEVFNNIIEYMYEQYRDKLKDKEKKELVNFDTLKVFLGKTAYYGLWGQCQNEKTVFDADEFKNDTIFRLSSEIGFLTNIQEHDYYRDRLPRRKIYTTEFFHKFIQEYFASCYLIHLQENFPNEAARKLDAIKQRANYEKASIVIFFCAPSTHVSTSKKRQYAEATLKNVDLAYMKDFHVSVSQQGDLPNIFDNHIQHVQGSGEVIIRGLVKKRRDKHGNEYLEITNEYN